MKKNIGFIPMDSVLQEWLLEKLMKEPPKSDCAEASLRLRSYFFNACSYLLVSGS